MKLPALICSDLHLTANPQHEYRWGLFKWLADECVSEGVKTLLILGDLTDAKDYHPSSLTNRLVQSLSVLTWLGLEIVILQGNHDYLREGHSYFAFLDNIPGIKFITQMQEVESASPDDGPSVFALPHCKNPAARWKDMDFSHYDILLMHQTVSGSIASNGQKMDGEPLPPLNAVKVYSGDIHVPQVIGEVEYVGSPYHVHFGDRFKPRCILLDKKGRQHDLHFETISRVALTVGSLQELRSIEGLKKGDHVKLRVSLDASEKHDWLRIKRGASEFLDKRGVEVFGIELVVKPSTQRIRVLGQEFKRSLALSDAEVIERFINHEGLGGDALASGYQVLE